MIALAVFPLPARPRATITVPTIGVTSFFQARQLIRREPQLLQRQIPLPLFIGQQHHPFPRRRARCLHAPDRRGPFGILRAKTARLRPPRPLLRRQPRQHLVCLDRRVRRVPVDHRLRCGHSVGDKCQGIAVLRGRPRPRPSPPDSSAIGSADLIGGSQSRRQGIIGLG